MKWRSLCYLRWGVKSFERSALSLRHLKGHSTEGRWMCQHSLRTADMCYLVQRHDILNTDRYVVFSPIPSLLSVGQLRLTVKVLQFRTVALCLSLLRPTGKRRETTSSAVLNCQVVSHVMDGNWSFGSRSTSPANMGADRRCPRVASV